VGEPAISEWILSARRASAAVEAEALAATKQPPRAIAPRMT
jgi:hypothetical protein